MTISNQTARTGPYNGNGSTTVFAYDFRALDQTHLVVTLKDAANVETVQTLTTNYTVSGVGDASGGNITMGVAPASGEQLTISRAVPQTQVVDLANRGAVAPEVLEGAYDKLTQLSQDKVELLNRVPRFPVSSSLTGVELPLTLTANTALIVNAAGTAYTNGPTASQISGAEASASAAASSATDSANSATASAASATTASQYAGTQTVDLFNGTGSQTAFTLSVAPANGDENNTDVHISGVYQQKNTYAVSGTTLTFSTAPPSGTGNVEVMHMSARAIETPADGSVTYPKFASGLVDTDLSAVSGSDDTIASAKAIKTYVDAQIGASNELSEVLANGNTSGGTNIVVSSGDSITTDTIAETTAAAGVTIDGVLVKDGEVDGRDVSVDGTKLDGIEAGADVTDTTNVTAAGALMDSELTNITAVKALNQGVATTDSPSFAGLTATTADINGGTIDGAVIGGSSAAAGTFTTLITTSNAGIGTATPSSAINGTLRVLEVSSSLGSAVRATDTTNSTNVEIAAGAGSTYVWNSTNTQMQFGTNNTSRMTLTAGGNLQMANAAGPSLLNEAATSTNPTLVPNKADPDTGVGWVSADIGALVAGGAEVARWDTTNGITVAALKDVNLSGRVSVSNITNVNTQGFRLADGTSSILTMLSQHSTGAFRIQQYDGVSAWNNRLTIDTDGNVGINTSTLNGTLLVIDQKAAAAPSSSGNMNTGSFLGAVGVGGAALNIGHDADGTWYNSAYFNNAGVARIHRWLTGGTERMRIDSSGNLEMADAAGPALLNEAATGNNPTLIPNKAYPTNGIGANNSGTISIIPGGTESFRVTATALQGVAANAPIIKNETPTSTNPVFVPSAGDPDTGMGWVSANVGALVAGGSSAAQWGSSSFSVAGALVSNVATAISGADRPLVTDDTANLVVYSTTTPATDVGGSIGLGHSSHGGALLAVIKGMKAASGTNIGELAFALRSDAAFATEMARLTSTQFGMSNAAGPALLNEAATNANPTVVPNKSDPDTGIAWNAANDLSLVAGAATNIRINSTTGSNGGTGSAGAGNQYVELNINGNRYKLLHDGTI
jgi:hypothetical protein